MSIRYGARETVQSVKDAQEQTTHAFTAIPLPKRRRDHTPDRALLSQVSLDLARV